MKLHKYILIVLLCGCKSTPLPTTERPIAPQQIIVPPPPPTNTLARKFKLAPAANVLPGPHFRTNDLHFQMDPTKTNYWWHLDGSTNMRTWFEIPITNYDPTNHMIVITNLGEPIKAFRLRGEQ